MDFPDDMPVQGRPAQDRGGNELQQQVTWVGRLRESWIAGALLPTFVAVCSLLFVGGVEAVWRDAKPVLLSGGGIIFLLCIPAGAAVVWMRHGWLGALLVPVFTAVAVGLNTHPAQPGCNVQYSDCHNEVAFGIYMFSMAAFFGAFLGIFINIVLWARRRRGPA